MARRSSRVVVAGLVMLALAGSACAKTRTTVRESPSPSPSFTTLAQGTLKVGSDIPYPPFEYKDKSDKLVGFDVDLMEAIAAKLGLTVEWVTSNFDTIFTSLAADKFDAVVSAVTAYAPQGSPAYDVVTKRRELVSFATAYYSSLQSLTVNAKRTPALATTDGLKSGDRVGVQNGTTGKFWADANLKPKGIQIVGYVKAPTMFDALEAGQLVGVVNDLPVSLEAIKSKSDLKVTQQIETGEQYGIAIAKSNPGLLAAVNAALDEMFADGSYATIFTKYFPDQQLPSYAKK
ncbi:MAG: transporter substrate-binding domain-containing protein [Actinomycetota bacterium]